MPLVYQQNINEATKLAVWHITESESFFSAEVSVQHDITHPHKRLQHLAGRYLLRENYPEFPLALIRIADTRKPFLADDTFHFSISHCADYAAAMVSKNYRVGVDIEIPQLKILQIQQKFLSEEELSLLTSLALPAEKLYTLCWSVKEAVFKWYGLGKVDFKKDMQIKSFRLDDHQGLVTVLFNKEPVAILQVHFLFFNGNVLAWVLSTR